MLKVRLFLTTIILTMLAQPVGADTTNRASQFSPFPAIFVGGVGLVCESRKPSMQFLLLTKDRKKLGVAKFENDDIAYDLQPIIKTTPRLYSAKNNDIDLVLDRQTVNLRYDVTYKCEAMRTSDAHKTAETYLRALLSKNKF